MFPIKREHLAAYGGGSAWARVWKMADFEQVTVASELRTVRQERASGACVAVHGPAVLQGWSLDGDQRESDMAGRNKLQTDAWTEDLEAWCDLWIVTWQGWAGREKGEKKNWAVLTPPTLTENHFLKNPSWACLSHTFRLSLVAFIHTP